MLGVCAGALVFDYSQEKSFLKVRQAWSAPQERNQTTTPTTLGTSYYEVLLTVK